MTSPIYEIREKLDLGEAVQHLALHHAARSSVNRSRKSTPFFRPALPLTSIYLLYESPSGERWWPRALRERELRALRAESRLRKTNPLSDAAQLLYHLTARV